MSPGKTILIVEDDSDVRESLAVFLEGEGYSVVEAEHGKEALRCLRSSTDFCLILLDLFMPVMTGSASRDEQLRDPSMAAIPLVVTTAAVGNAGGLGIVSFGANPPPLVRRLIRRVRELTDRPFGVNFILPLAAPEQVAACIEERAPVLSTFWGDPAPYVEPAHAAGIKV